MAVIINEFEVLADAEPAPRGDAAANTTEGPAHEKPDPLEVLQALCALRWQALRVWAH